MIHLKFRNKFYMSIKFILGQAKDMSPNNVFTVIPHKSGCLLAESRMQFLAVFIRCDASAKKYKEAIFDERILGFWVTPVEVGILCIL